jgi:hypothetical protein
MWSRLARSSSATALMPEHRLRGRQAALVEQRLSVLAPDDRVRPSGLHERIRDALQQREPAFGAQRPRILRASLSG